MRVVSWAGLMSLTFSPMKNAGKACRPSVRLSPSYNFSPASATAFLRLRVRFWKVSVLVAIALLV